MGLVENKFYTQLLSSPYASDDYTAGIYREPKSRAAGRKYIQPNGNAALRWMVLDIDDVPSTAVPWLDADVPPPHFDIESPHKLGSHHYLYGILPFVGTGERSRVHPQAYLSAVTTGYVRELGADERYTGLICRNPLSSFWHKTKPKFDADLYTLGGLACWFVLVGDKSKAGKVIESGLSRNCDVFDALRRWAYREIWTYRDHLTSWQAHLSWSTAVHEQAKELNGSLAYPLSLAEAAGIARSVAGWVWTRADSRDWRKRWLAKQATRGRKGGLVTASRYDMGAVAAAAAAKRDMSAVAAAAAAKRDMSSLGQGSKVQETSERQRKPWERLGVHRATYYRWKAAGKLGQ